MPQSDPTEYSKRLGPIRDEQFQAALERFDLGQFVCAEPIAAGLFGQNVFVTSTRGRFVLRGKPHFTWQFPKERFFAGLLHERTQVPVPWPYRVDPSTDIFGFSYVLMPRMPGQPAWDLAKPFDDQLAIAHAAGETLAMAQELAWPLCGEYEPDGDTIRPHAAGYASWLVDDVRRNLRKSCELAPDATEGDVPWAEALLARAEEAFADVFEPCFVMNDYRLGNMVVDRVSGGQWRVSGLFDLMECRFGDGENDLVRLVYSYLRDAGPGGRELAKGFVQGYRRTKPLRGRFAERFALHTLRDRLIYWTYGHGPGVNWYLGDLTLRQYVEPYLSSLEALL
jgi:aminoglycoside phosphotransferase (APT) family kinase protein